MRHVAHIGHNMQILALHIAPVLGAEWPNQTFSNIVPIFIEIEICSVDVTCSITHILEWRAIVIANWILSVVIIITYVDAVILKEVFLICFKYFSII